MAAMSTDTDHRVLIVGIDGLRPDLIDAALMPSLCALAREGVRFRDHHAVYPSHTRPNVAAMATGCTPGRHGILANTMQVVGAREDHIIEVSDYQHIDALDRHSGGRALLAPSLGELLAPYGGRVAVASSGTAGPALFWSFRDRSRLVNTSTAYGIADLYDLREKLGEIPDAGLLPQLERARYVTRAVTDLFLDDPENRVVVAWFSEPDSSQHYRGLGSAEALAGMAGIDGCLETILAALEQRGLRASTEILVVSDHGHATVAAHHTLREYLLTAAGVLGDSLPPLTTASDLIYAAPGTPEPAVTAIAPLVEWLLAQPWTGAVLGGTEEIAALPGVIPLSALWNGSSNERRPLLAVSPRWSDEPNAHGVPGTIAALTTQAALRSSHGSASPYEMHATLIAAGPGFRRGIDSALPSGNTDLLPTVLTLLGVPVPDGLDGRVLQEALVLPTAAVEQPSDTVIGPARTAPGIAPARIHLRRAGHSSYVHGALQPNAPSLTFTVAKE